MMQVENRNIFVWLGIMIAAMILFSASYGALFGVYTGFKIAGPAAVEFTKSNDMSNVQSEADLTEDQKNAIEKQTIEQMREINWWLWFPLLSGLSWLITSFFLGFMKLVKYNEALVILIYIPSLIMRDKEWAPPGSIFIEVFTILVALVLVHFVSRWISSKRKRA